MTRSELEDLVRRYRVVWRERNREPLVRLTWHDPGAVWAIDYTHAPVLIDGQFPYLLAIRDLASGMTLAWHPVASATADEAAATLARLFAVHGAPLVVKSDNGSHFTASQVTELLRIHQVAHLLSPAYYPRYNGSIEAGIGSLKLRTDQVAIRQGHPAKWTLDDLATAVAEANSGVRDRGKRSIEEVWDCRERIGDRERAAFVMQVASGIAGLDGCESSEGG